MSDVETPDSARPRRPKVGYTAPVASVDLVAFDDDGKPYEVWPCHDCYPWHVEVFIDPSDDRIYLREWHAYECPQLQSLIDQVDDD